MNELPHSHDRPRRRWVVDVSDLWNFLGRRSGIAGIQRVLLEVAANRSAWPHDEIVLGHWNPLLERYAEFPLGEREDFGVLRARLQIPRSLGPTPGKYADVPLRRVAYATRRRLESTWQTLAHAPRVRRRIESSFLPIELRAGDVILSLGSGWDANVRAALDHVAPEVAAGRIRLVSLVHDLLPFHPDSNEHTQEKTALFEDWFRQITGLTGRFLVYSRATERDLRQALARRGVSAPRIERFPLAHEHATGPTSANPRIDPKVRALQRHPFVLSVGPVRGRKNGTSLVAAWSNLAARHGAGKLPTLVFAGSGRRDQIAVSVPPDVDSKIAFVRSPSDATLRSLYRNALFCVFPSRHEGWGLPVGESLWHGRLCLTSSTSSLPEVGGPLADYFDPDDVEAIADCLERALFDPVYRAGREAEIAKAPLRTWHESTGLLFEAATRLVA